MKKKDVSDITKEKKPNPGSTEAVKLGCTCPIMDNNYGQGLSNGDFWVTQGCPLHDKQSEFLNKKV